MSFSFDSETNKKKNTGYCKIGAVLLSTMVAIIYIYIYIACQVATTLP